MDELKKYQIMRQVEQQYIEQELSIPESHPTDEKQGYLKKQSQSVPGQNVVTSYLKGDYGKIPLCGAQENKANLSHRE
jgi:hypothetical protein